MYDDPIFIIDLYSNTWKKKNCSKQLLNKIQMLITKTEISNLFITW